VIVASSPGDDCYDFLVNAGKQRREKNARLCSGLISAAESAGQLKRGCDGERRSAQPPGEEEAQRRKRLNFAR